MGVIMQAFYWDCPKLESKEFQWWNSVSGKISQLSNAGFTALWLPPATKGANLFGDMSMGYDPYDFYDLGEFDQRGSIPTWFGTRAELEALIKTAHSHNMQVYADMVLNHTNGADEEEINPLDGKKRWTKYNPASNKFSRDWTCYHPSNFERWDDEAFEDMPDLCHRNPDVYKSLLEYARWLIEDIGFDGFRYDFVKGYGLWLIYAIIERLYKKEGNNKYSPFGVGEYWSDDASITKWLREVNKFSDNPITAFDFGLRDRLKSLCDQYGFSLQTLMQKGTFLADGFSNWAVTFVENHDIVRKNPIINDKILAYAYILTHEGYPCVFWQDYYNWNLADEGGKNGIAALVQAHEKYAGGATTVLYCDDNLYIMQRQGYGAQKGLVFILNNSGVWSGNSVIAQWANTKFKPVAWCGGNNTDVPLDKWTNNHGETDFWAPPRGYVVYVPEE
jgi:alpha-amylase